MHHRACWIAGAARSYFNATRKWTSLSQRKRGVVIVLECFCITRGRGD